MGWFVTIFILMAAAIGYMRGDTDGYCEGVEDGWKAAEKYYKNKE